ncbi:MAG: adenylosuccinate synthase [Paludibacteraceae bacterium]|nr:adenylosuccinate synthase [Paludibacteraceae bacterium]MBP6285127.1 adenylosuccinate synthase [Paludibacteraceae bacterium]
MKVDVLLGLQWGDEGKGKVIDVLTPKYDVIARFQGGPNAGHTLEFDGKKFVLHTIPSGIFQGDKINIIGNGVVIDPIIFRKEVEKLENAGYDLSKKLVISKKAHLILPTHRLIDAAQEAQKGNDKIGSTLKGIGPTYADKVSRTGLRVGDLTHNFTEKYTKKIAEHTRMLDQMGFEYSLDGLEEEWMEATKVLQRFELIDSEHVVNNMIANDKQILAEGAQGTMLDIEFGSYPFVTSSNTISAGVCIGLGVPPTQIGEVFGIMKAYCTRVGSGPFPTELFDNDGETMRAKGNEFGSTTGRARRCGWIDLVALKYAIMINGVTQLIMMKSDVLDEFDTIKMCVGYKIDGEEVDYFPYEIDSTLEPIYAEIPGWKTDMSKMQKESQFPLKFNDYLDFLEDELEVPIRIVSVGPDREQTILRYINK